MILDDGKMERMQLKYWDAPCKYCNHSIFDHNNFEIKCPFFKDGIIPEDIVSGKNKHVDVHPLQEGTLLFEERIIEFRK